MVRFDMPTLMMVSHGNSGNGGDPAGALADVVRDQWDGPVRHGYMRSQPSLPDQLDRLKQDHEADRLIVFPLFFSEGYLVVDELPRNLRDAGLGEAIILPPAINLPGFLEMVGRQINTSLARRGWCETQSSVFLVPHGLKTLTAALPETIRFAKDLGRLCTGVEICIGNIEGNPSLADWRTIGSRKNVLMVPMLAGGGTHADDDLPEMIGVKSGDAIEILGPVGEWPQLPDLILAEAAKHGASRLRPSGDYRPCHDKSGHNTSREETGATRL
ncbi:sirohydrochlorin chelatase [Thalassospira alkalitolerans]|uniref:sirohydrochlorin chelatase n=1 Tax=Thalassospira alkalitolerans TaxID=1293890 RepID=UPI0030ED87DD|tara:strand:- start:163811 stop:164626 length:816 start_codon:yes stop_codon:yes gene_type:complete